MTDNNPEELTRFSHELVRELIRGPVMEVCGRIRDRAAELGATPPPEWSPDECAGWWLEVVIIDILTVSLDISHDLYRRTMVDLFELTCQELGVVWYG